MENKFFTIWDKKDNEKIITIGHESSISERDLKMSWCAFMGFLSSINSTNLRKHIKMFDLLLGNAELMGQAGTEYEKDTGGINMEKTFDTDFLLTIGKPEDIIPDTVDEMFKS